MLLGTRAGDISCASITIRDDATFEDVEAFQVVLSTDSDMPTVQLGNTTVAVVRIEDRGERGRERERERERDLL